MNGRKRLDEFQPSEPTNLNALIALQRKQQQQGAVQQNREIQAGEQQQLKQLDAQKRQAEAAAAAQTKQTQQQLRQAQAQGREQASIAAIATQKQADMQAKETQKQLKSQQQQQFRQAQAAAKLTGGTPSPGTTATSETLQTAQQRIQQQRAQQTKESRQINTSSGSQTMSTIKSLHTYMQLVESQHDLEENQVMEKAPPGKEHVVRALKKKFPGHEESAFAIAWSQRNKKHRKTDESVNESLELEDYENMTDSEFEREYGMSKHEWKQKHGSDYETFYMKAAQLAKKMYRDNPSNPAKNFRDGGKQLGIFAEGSHEPRVSKREKKLEESKEHIMESTLDEVLGNYPHEHKMCQEGWGMDESLYEALCDHYFKEGRIPRSVWHGPMEELRRHVEECYGQDTGMLVGEGAMGAVAGGIAGGMIGKSPSAVVTGANIGDKIQDVASDLLSGDEHEEQLDEIDQTMYEGHGSELEQMVRHAAAHPTEESMYESKFSKLKGKLAKQPGITDPAALAASIGRKKLGQAEMTRRSVAGRKRADEAYEDGMEEGAGVMHFKAKQAKAKGDESFKLGGKTYPVKEGFKDVVRKGANVAKKVGGKVLDYIAPSDEQLLKDLQKKVGVPQTGKPPASVSKKTDRDEIQEGDMDESKPATAKQRKFAALAEPKDKITFADKIAGATKGKKKVSEATKETPTGRIHKADPGGYGRKHDTDEEGEEKAAKKEPVKRGRGRPKKNADSETGEEKKFDFSALLKPVKLKDPKGEKLGGRVISKMRDAEKAEAKAEKEEAKKTKGKKTVKEDAQISAWQSQLHAMLNEGVMTPAVPNTSGSASPVPGGQDETSKEHGDIMSALRAILANAGMQAPAASAATGDQPSSELDGSELQSGVSAPVNSKDAEPGSRDPRNDVIAGQVFVPQLPMPRGMGMSIEGDVHTHEIDNQPQSPDEIQSHLSADCDDEVGDIKGLIDRLLGGRKAAADGHPEAKLIVPYGDYEQEAGQGSIRQHAGDGQDTAVPVGVGEPDEVGQLKRLAGTAGGIMSSGLEEDGYMDEDAAFGHATGSPTAMGEEATFGHQTGAPTAMEEEATFGHQTGAPTAMEEEALPQPGTFEEDAVEENLVVEPNPSGAKSVADAKRLGALSPQQPKADVPPPGLTVDQAKQHQSYQTNPAVKKEVDTADQITFKEDAEEQAPVSGDDMGRLMSKLDELLNMVDSAEDAEKLDEGYSEWDDTGAQDMGDAVAQASQNAAHAETEDDIAMTEGYGSCNECGAMYEGHMDDHVCEDNYELTQHAHSDHTMSPLSEEEHETQLNEWANTPQNKEDESFETDIDFMTKFISGGLNNIKRNQTVLPSAEVVTKSESANPELSIAQQLRKLAGLN